MSPLSFSAAPEGKAQRRGLRRCIPSTPYRVAPRSPAPSRPDRKPSSSSPSDHTILATASPSTMSGSPKGRRASQSPPGDRPPLQKGQGDPPALFLVSTDSNSRHRASSLLHSSQTSISSPRISALQNAASRAEARRCTCFPCGSDSRRHGRPDRCSRPECPHRRLRKQPPGMELVELERRPPGSLRPAAPAHGGLSARRARPASQSASQSYLSSCGLRRYRAAQAPAVARGRA